MSSKSSSKSSSSKPLSKPPSSKSSKSLKRNREDNKIIQEKNEITSEIIDIVVIDDDDNNNNKLLSKAEKNLLRKKKNKEWKFTDRKVGSGKDPNPRHTLYFQAQCPELANVDEWNLFQACLVDPLPVSFRVGHDCPTSVELSIKHRMDNEFKLLRGRYVEIGGKVLKEIVKKVPWADSTWQTSVDTISLAKNEALEPISKFLIREVSLGHIVRQEVVSMIPALLLDIKSDHTVLDVCAAPGSKTEQLITLMQRNGHSNGSIDKNNICRGMVVANDADPVRIGTLKKRYSKCGSPNLLVVCSRAEDLYVQASKNKVLFDRILADVPCSGDGTFRKCPHLWRLFRPRLALELHVIQLQIAKSCVMMLKPGGRIVYSTCSINPLEDEAVVAGLLRHFKGKLRLVDTKAEGLLPGLVSRPGLSTWLCNKDIFTIGEPDEESRLESLSRLPPLVDSMYPPSSEEALEMNLQLCHRLYPHDQNTGGFFVAVLELSKDNIKDISININSSEYNSLKAMHSLGYNPKKSLSNKEEKDSKKIKLSTSAWESDQHTGKLSFPMFGKKHDGIAQSQLYSSIDTIDKSIIFENLNFKPKEIKQGLVDEFANKNYLYLVSSKVIKEVSVKKNLDDEETPEERMKKRIKQQAQGNGIFGSKSTGWKKLVDTDDNNEIEDKFNINLVSSEVNNALLNWANNGLLVKQAGINIANMTNDKFLIKGYAVPLVCLKHIENDRIINIDKEDFITLLEFTEYSSKQQHDSNEIDGFYQSDPIDIDAEEEESMLRYLSIYLSNNIIRRICIYLSIYQFLSLSLSNSTYLSLYLFMYV
jgi:16S rRNA C967 or C1407 C5-methylase (RsmB/RsmF family)